MSTTATKTKTKTKHSGVRAAKRPGAAAKTAAPVTVTVAAEKKRKTRNLATAIGNGIGPAVWITSTTPAAFNEDALVAYRAMMKRLVGVAMGIRGPVGDERLRAKHVEGAHRALLIIRSENLVYTPQSKKKRGGDDDEE